MPTLADLTIIETKLPRVIDGTASPQRLHAAQCLAKQDIKLKHVIRDHNGNPVDLSNPVNVTVKMYTREALMITPNVQESIGTIIDAPNGVVLINVNKEAVEVPGISKGDIMLFDQNQNLLFGNRIYLIVNSNIYSTSVSQNSPQGPPTLQEIKLFIRDSSPEEALWRGIEEFEWADIAIALERALQYFNDSPPLLAIKYNTVTFPYRFYWMLGASAVLLQTAAIHYARTHLPYQSGGVAIDDRNKFQIYQALGDRYWQEYRQWVLQTKIRMNMEGASGILGSAYRFAPTNITW